MEKKVTGEKRARHHLHQAIELNRPWYEMLRRHHVISVVFLFKIYSSHSDHEETSETPKVRDCL